MLSYSLRNIEVWLKSEKPEKRKMKKHGLVSFMKIDPKLLKFVLIFEFEHPFTSIIFCKVFDA